MVIEELAAVVRMYFQDGKGQATAQPAKSVLHHDITASQDSHALAPAGTHVNHLQSVHVIARGTRPTVMHQVYLKMARLAFIPGQALHRHFAQNLVGALRATPWQTPRDVSLPTG